MHRQTDKQTDGSSGGPDKKKVVKGLKSQRENMGITATFSLL
jgi:hypothetical protein